MGVRHSTSTKRGLAGKLTPLPMLQFLTKGNHVEIWTQVFGVS
jgi:hypothetical protein